MHHSILLLLVAKALILALPVTGTCQEFSTGAHPDSHYFQSDNQTFVELKDWNDRAFAEPIRQMADSLQHILQLHVRISLSERQVFLSSPADGVILDALALKMLKTNLKSEIYNLVTKFIIAHELAHQLQYAQYGAMAVLQASCLDRSKYESQADIIAGIAVTRLLGIHFNFEKTEEGLQKGLQLTNLLAFVYTLGEPEYSLASHPSMFQRRNSVGFGISLGVALNSRPTNLDDYNGDLCWNGREDILPWSLKIARLIVHDGNEIARGLQIVVRPTGALEDPKELKWYKTGDYPYARYSYIYRNTGDRPITVTVAYRLFAVPRTVNWEYSHPEIVPAAGHCQYHTFTLRPNAEYACSGLISWSGLSTDQTMPQFIRPPKENSLYCVEYADRLSDASSTPCYDDMTLRLYDTVRVTNLLSGLEEAVQHAMTGFQYLMTGIGEMNNGYLTFHSALSIPYANLTEIKMNKNRTWLVARFNYLESNPKSIYRTYEALKQTLTVYSNTPLKEDDLSYHNRRDSEYHSFTVPAKTGNAKIELEYEKYKDDSSPEVSLSVIYSK